MLSMGSIGLGISDEASLDWGFTFFGLLGLGLMVSCLQYTGPNTPLCKSLCLKLWVHDPREELQEKAMAELTQLSQRAEAHPSLKGTSNKMLQGALTVHLVWNPENPCRRLLSLDNVALTPGPVAEVLSPHVNFNSHRGGFERCFKAPCHDVGRGLLESIYPFAHLSI